MLGDDEGVECLEVGLARCGECGGDGVLDGGVLEEVGLDLAELDAVALDLDLEVLAAEELERAGRAGSGRDRRCGSGARR